jgi:RNA polymerase sigma-70 factor, ECF subfamily
MPFFHRNPAEGKPIDLTDQALVGFTDQELIGRITESDTRAFDELYRRYSQRLLHYFARMLGAEKAQDFLQELFLKVIEKKASFAADGSFSTWVFSIAHNMCCNEYRYMAVRRDTVAADVDQLHSTKAHPGIERQLDHAAFVESLTSELEGLDQVKRSTFLLRFQEEFSIDAIARIMNCSAGTVKSRLFYTTRLLAERLKAFHPCLDEENQYE